MVNTLYLSGAGTVSIDMRDAGNIVGLTITGNDASSGACEVSFNSSSSLATNDTTGVIGGLQFTGSVVPQSFNSAMKEPVDVGERIFLHQTGVANTVRVFLYSDADTKRAAVRRR